MPTAIRYARAPDGTRIAWSSVGRGRPAILLTDGIGCAGYIWRRLAPALARERRVVHWNYRGHGRSGAPLDPAQVSVERCVEDLLAVLDAAGEDRAVLAGHSMGVQISLEAHRRAPERVAGLVLLCGAPGRMLDAFHDSAVMRTVFPWVRALFERWPRAAASGFRAAVASEAAVEYALAFEVNRALVHRADLRRYFRDLGRVDPGLFVRLLDSAAAHDASDRLPEVRVPALVVAGERDAFTPMRLSVKMHEAIPGSAFAVLPAGTHMGPLECPERVEDAVRRFLAERLPAGRRTRAAPAPRATARPKARPQARRHGARAAPGPERSAGRRRRARRAR
jgi:pimeloyl-ACP methyl ester carboxylesterase